MGPLVGTVFPVLPATGLVQAKMGMATVGLASVIAGLSVPVGLMVTLAPDLANLAALSLHT